VTVVIDICLPLSWVEYLRKHGHTARPWRELGPPDAPDTEIMQWAVRNDAVVLTHDLDFTKLLFQSGGRLPSVIQLRLDDVRPAVTGEDVVLILKQHEETLRRGALISVKFESREGVKFVFHRIGEAPRPRRVEMPLPREITEKWDVESPALEVEDWEMNR
jgi:predicted nuclease of predicted toxin-antitoxin system